MLQVDPFLHLAVRKYNNGSGFTVSLVFNHGRYYLLGPPGTNDCVVKSVTLGVLVCLLISFVVFFVVNEAFEPRKEALAQAVTVI